MLKIIATILLFFMYVSQAWGVVLIQRTASSTSYIFHETFETSTGDETDETWTTATGTPNFNASSSTYGMVGTYCATLTDSGTDVQVTTSIDTDTAQTWISLAMRMSDGTPTDDIFAVYVNGATEGLLTLRFRAAGTIRAQILGDINIYLVDQDGAALTLPSTDTGVFYIKIRIKNVSSGSSEVEVFYTDTGTWGSSIETLVSTITEDAEELKIFNTMLGTTTTIDEVKADDADISDY